MQKEQNEQQYIEETPKKTFLLLLMSRRGLVAIFGIILGLAAVGAAWSFAGKDIAISSPSNRAAGINQEETQKEIERLIKKVRKHILLPENEEPIVATVVDADALAREQPFYHNIRNGDKLLIYQNALRALIYSPERDILVNVGPVQIQQNIANQESAANTNVVPPERKGLTIEIRNGSKKNGAAKALSEELAVYQGYTIAAVADASRNTYADTLLIDLSDGEKPGLVLQLADQLGVEVVNSLPGRENASSANVVIIIGDKSR